MSKNNATLNKEIASDNMAWNRKIYQITISMWQCTGTHLNPQSGPQIKFKGL